MSKLSWSDEVKEETLKCLNVDILKEELFNIVNYYKTDEEIEHSETTKNNKITIDCYDIIESIIEEDEDSCEVDDIIHFLNERIRNRVDTAILNKMSHHKLDKGTFIIGYNSIREIIKTLPRHSAALYVNVYCSEDLTYEEYIAKYAKQEIFGDKLTPIGNDCYIEFQAKHKYTLDIYCHKAIIQYTGYESYYEELLGEHKFLTDTPYDYFGENDDYSDGEINKLYIKESDNKRRKDLFTAEREAQNEVYKLGEKLESAIMIGVARLGIKTDKQANKLIQQLYKSDLTSLEEGKVTTAEKVALVDKILADINK